MEFIVGEYAFQESNSMDKRMNYIGKKVNTINS